MHLTVFLERTNKHMKITLEKNATVTTLLEHMKINPVEVVVSLNKEVVTEDAVIQDGDNVTIFSVISGG
ncbi:MAG: MoaD/ThiS family protein [Nanoarchaeota archaeon]